MESFGCSECHERLQWLLGEAEHSDEAAEELKHLKAYLAVAERRSHERGANLMTADLSPDVRDRAIAAVGAILCDWVGLADAQKWAAPPVVDAVVAVVAPEITRPLQARIAELKAEVKLLEAQEDHLREQAGDMAADKLAAEARVELLTAALTGLLDAAAVTPPFDEQYTPRGGWTEHPVITRARAALAAGTTESEAP